MSKIRNLPILQYQDHEKFSTATDFFSVSDELENLDDIFIFSYSFVQIIRNDGTTFDIVGFYECGNFYDCFDAKTFKPLGYVVYNRDCKIKHRNLTVEEYNLYLKLENELPSEIKILYNKEGDSINPDVDYTTRDAAKIIGISYPALLKKIKLEEIEKLNFYQGYKYRVPGINILRYLSKNGGIVLTEI